MALSPKLTIYLVFWLLLLAGAFAQGSEWRPIAKGPGLFFSSAKQNENQHTCTIRLREEKKLRRTASDLIITYRFQQVDRSRKYSAHFEARDTDTVYLDDCEQVLTVIASKVQRW
ncbi:MAG TPA: hypothetical protein VIW67_09665 [Terriglobales bacterium]|jgi:hypothetical protein